MSRKIQVTEEQIARLRELLRQPRRGIRIPEVLGLSPNVVKRVMREYGIAAPVRDAAWFWSMVEHGDGCWIWKGPLTGLRGSAFRYGMFTRDWKRVLAHRYAFELTHGPIPTTVFICHRCDNPPCVRPDHLFAGTPADNAHDRDRKGRQVAHAGDANGLRLHPESIRRGEDHHAARLAADDVHSIRRLYATGEWSMTDLGSRYEISRRHVRDIILRRTWSHLPARDDEQFSHDSLAPLRTPKYLARAKERSRRAAANPAVRARRRAGLQRVCRTPEWRERRRQIALATWADPEKRARRLDGMRRAIAERAS